MNKLQTDSANAATPTAHRTTTSQGVEATANIPSLPEAAKAAQSSDEFIRSIQQNPALLSKLYEWERSTPENIQRFNQMGWFGIAAVYWDEARASIIR